MSVYSFVLYWLIGYNQRFLPLAVLPMTEKDSKTDV